MVSRVLFSLIMVMMACDTCNGMKKELAFDVQQKRDAQVIQRLEKLVEMVCDEPCEVKIDTLCAMYQLGCGEPDGFIFSDAFRDRLVAKIGERIHGDQLKSIIRMSNVMFLEKMTDTNDQEFLLALCNLVDRVKEKSSWLSHAIAGEILKGNYFLDGKSIFSERIMRDGEVIVNRFDTIQMEVDASLEQ